MASDLCSVLVIHPGGLGDVLLAVPALQAIRSHYPTQELVLLAGTEVGHLLQQCGVVDRILPMEAGHLATLFIGPQQLSPSIHNIAKRCELAIGWLKDSDGSLLGTLREAGIPRVIVEAPMSGTRRHQSERFLASVEKVIGTGHEGSVRLTLPESLLQAAITELKKTGLGEGVAYVVCHPGSGSPHKCVRADRWLDILSGCRARGLAPVIVAGPADEQAVQALGEEGLKDIPVLRPKNLTALSGILAQAKGYIGHDSGVTHLSALLGVPTVAMFGPTDPQQWAPRGAHVSVATGAACSCSGWSAVQTCREKACLQVPVIGVLHGLDNLLARYRQVTNS
ncbi:MAG: glycosyltransferase family 9 protein [Nitrospira sp.]|jgi:heptosyltransferase-3|nr:glycosyltransferase family 9 protein [Nitrospira sp.]